MRSHLFAADLMAAMPYWVLPLSPSPSLRSARSRLWASGLLLLLSSASALESGGGLLYCDIADGFKCLSVPVTDCCLHIKRVLTCMRDPQKKIKKEE